MNHWYGRQLLLAMAIVFFGAVALGSGPIGLNAAAQSGSVVTVVDFAFQPATLTVKVGTAVNWANAGKTSHTVTADDGTFDSGPIGPGASFSQIFKTAGTYTYHCSIHPNMIGTIHVVVSDTTELP